MPKKIKILLAEDNSNDIKILRHNLKTGGMDFTLTTVQTPEDFRSNLTSFQPDIVLSDYSMPQFNGMEALKIKKQVYPGIPFIIVTGSLNEETAVECIKAGADDYVVKEHISAIVPAVLSALDKYDLEREKVKLQNEIAEREEKYRSIFSVSADAIIIVEKETGKIIDANEAACRLYKYQLTEFLELHYNRILNTPIFNYPSFNNDSGLVNYHITKEGNLIPVELSYSSYIRNNLTYLIINIRDIAKRIEAEKELENYRNHLEHMVTERTLKLAEVNKQLADNLEKEKAIEETVKIALTKEKELNELKSKFISTISHEFRTPLATILSSIELMELFGQKWNSEKQFKHILRIKESIKNLTSLLDEILTISRVETGKIKLNPELKDLNELCKKIVDDIKELSGRNHDVIYKFTIERNEFLIDEKLLKYILNNLLSNSVKYTPEKGKIELTVSAAKGDICFEVKDNGIGIPKKDQQHLFEPFFRANNIQNISGSGLGLSIVKNSVDLYKGKISFESRENKGTIFRVYIPITNITGVN